MFCVLKMNEWVNRELQLKLVGTKQSLGQDRLFMKSRPANTGKNSKRKWFGRLINLKSEWKHIEDSKINEATEFPMVSAYALID